MVAEKEGGGEQKDGEREREGRRERVEGMRVL